MPRVRSKVTLSYKQGPLDEAGGPQATQVPSTGRGMGYSDGCNCSKCMKKAGPVHGDRRERLDAIADILNKYFQPEVLSPKPEQLYAEDKLADLRYKAAIDFLTAVEENQPETLRKCFESVDSYSDDHSSIASELMFTAAQLGHVDVMRVLVEFGDCVDAVDEPKCGTPLMYACHNGHTAAVKALVESPLNASLDNIDNNGYTALMVCTFCDRAAAAEILVKAGASVDKECLEHSRTALCYAAHYGSLDCLQVLGNAGADPFWEDADGLSVLDLADKSGRPGCVEAVRKLQQKARMHKKLKGRRGGDSKGGNNALSEAERQKAEAEAEARAAQLLAEIELEGNMKAAKPSAQSHPSSQQQVTKKDKNRASEQQQQQNQPSLSSTPSANKLLQGAAKADGGRIQHINNTPQQPAQQQQKPQQQPQRAQQQKRHGKVPATPLPPPSATPANPQKPVLITPGTHAISAQHQQQLEQQSVQGPGSNASGVDDAQLLAAALRGEASPLDQDMLRRQWEAVLQEASRCRDDKQQPTLLSTVQRLLPACNEAGISVKYGRKVLQRLEVVAPSRTALQSALQPPCRSAQLERALRNARPAASLLDPQLLMDAEMALASCKAEEERSKWDMLASQLKRLQAPIPRQGGTVAASQTPSTVLLSPPLSQQLCLQETAGAGYLPPDFTASNTSQGAAASYAVPAVKGVAQPGLQEAAPAPAHDVPTEEEIECVVCLEVGSELRISNAREREVRTLSVGCCLQKSLRAPFAVWALSLSSWQAERVVICVPCMHICLCAGCAADVLKRAQPECPVCRCGLEDMFEIAC